LSSLDLHKGNLRSLRENLTSIGKTPKVISIGHDDFVEFEKDYMKRKRKLAEKRRNEREECYDKIGISNRNSMVVPCKKWGEINERENELKKIDERRQHEVFDRAKIRFTYGINTKKNHWPEISKKKHQELLNRNNTLESKSGNLRKNKPLTSRISKSTIGAKLIDNVSQGGSSIPTTKTTLHIVSFAKVIL
jgi:hypothetical protein